MLILTRKKGDIIDVVVGGKSIEIVIMRVSSGQVRIGIDADDDVSINRREVTDRINVEGKKAKRLKPRMGSKGLCKI